MQSFIGFILRFNLNFLSMLIIGDENRSISDQCTLNGATNLLPRVLFVVKLESHGKHDQFVDVYGDVTLLVQCL